MAVVRHAFSFAWTEASGALDVEVLYGLRAGDLAQVSIDQRRLWARVVKTWAPADATPRDWVYHGEVTTESEPGAPCALGTVVAFRGRHIHATFREGLQPPSQPQSQPR